MPTKEKDKIIFLKDKVLHSSAGGFVFFEARDHVLYVALLKTKVGHFVIPKGHLQIGESAQNAAIREIKEELGINIRLNPIGHIGQSKYKFKNKGKRIHYKTVDIFAFAVKRRVPLFPETAEGLIGAEWFRAEDALKKIEFDKKLLLKSIGAYYAHFYNLSDLPLIVSSEISASIPPA
ncbi:MAG: NUDIX domain-containing protein [Candidatus Pacebacteria bacterium]|nr:NUDIX domain-containing protein [Candidatus Paceibacterota bacterium]